MERFCTYCLKWKRFEGRRCLGCSEVFERDCEGCGLWVRGFRGCAICDYVHRAYFGGWYPQEEGLCRQELEGFEGEGELEEFGLPLLGGVVPHAGWYYSGALASKVFRSIRRSWGELEPDVFVVLGTVHRAHVPGPCILAGGVWRTPLGDLEVDTSLALRILERDREVFHSAQVHQTEHSIEVEMPFIRFYFPGVRVLPLMVPARRSCAQLLGKVLGESIEELGLKAVVVASSDFSHYGKNFGYMPWGRLPGALERVHQVDRALIDRILRLESEGIVEEARRNRSACGAGALTAMVEVCQRLGGHRGRLLEYTTSCEVRPQEGRDSTVGYAAVVVEGG